MIRGFLKRLTVDVEELESGTRVVVVVLLKNMLEVGVEDGLQKVGVDEPDEGERPDCVKPDQFRETFLQLTDQTFIIFISIQMIFKSHSIIQDDTPSIFDCDFHKCSVLVLQS